MKKAARKEKQRVYQEIYKAVREKTRKRKAAEMEGSGIDEENIRPIEGSGIDEKKGGSIEGDGNEETRALQEKYKTIRERKAEELRRKESMDKEITKEVRGSVKWFEEQ